MPNPGLRLKEPAIAGYAYNPPQTPPFEKEGLVVSLSAYLTKGEPFVYLPRCAIQIAILRFARYLWHSMQKLRGARLVLYAKRKGAMQILRLL